MYTRSSNFPSFSDTIPYKIKIQVKHMWRVGKHQEESKSAVRSSSSSSSHLDVGFLGRVADLSLPLDPRWAGRRDFKSVSARVSWAKAARGDTERVEMG